MAQSAYYNESDPFAVEWLRQLIREGMIAEGVVDSRSIEDVVPEDLKGFTQHHFFAGIGVWSYALRQSGWPDDFPVWTASLPCQPFSTAGKKRGTNDKRHLWPVFFRLTQEFRPDVLFGEQVASPAGRAWADIVARDLENENYACAQIITGDAALGGWTRRERLYWVAAHPDGQQKPDMLRPCREERGSPVAPPRAVDIVDFSCGRSTARKWLPQSPFGWVADGTPSRVEQLRCYGNAIVSRQARAFIEAYLSIPEGALS